MPEAKQCNTDELGEKYETLLKLDMPPVVWGAKTLFCNGIDEWYLKKHGDHWSNATPVPLQHAEAMIGQQCRLWLGLELSLIDACLAQLQKEDNKDFMPVLEFSLYNYIALNQTWYMTIRVLGMGADECSGKAVSYEHGREKAFAALLGWFEEFDVNEISIKGQVYKIAELTFALVWPPKLEEGEDDGSQSNNRADAKRDGNLA